MFKKISLVLVLVLGLACTSFATDRYVAAGGTGTKTGLSWVSAYVSLNSALAVAVSGDTIYVAAGTYIPSGTTFTVPAGVNIKGGYSNYAASYNTVTSIGEVYNPQAYPVVLSGDTNGDDINGNLYSDPNALNAAATRTENKDTIMTLSGGTTTIDGCTFWHGGKTPSGANGGGIACGTSGTITINNCQFVGNVGNGAGIYTNTASVTVSNSLFQFNGAGQGVIYSLGTLSATGCTFKGNSNCGLNGSGITWGGAASCAITDCVVVDGVSGVGTTAFGSLCLKTGVAGTASISNCLIQNDQANVSSTLFQNSAAVAVTFNATNCLWTGCKGNSAAVQVLPQLASGTTTVNLVNCTVADNKASGATGGIGLGAATSLKNTSLVLNLKDSIVWGNSGAQVYWDTTATTFTSSTYNPFNITYSCIDTTDAGNKAALWKGSYTARTGLVVADPLFIGSGDYHVQSASPCIDKGNPASAYANEPYSYNGCRVNMGAYGNTVEAETTAKCVALTADSNGDCMVNSTDLLAFRQQWQKSCP